MAALWPVGVILLWKSKAWNIRDKLIGTLLPPGGYLGVAIILRLLGASLGGGATASASSDFGSNLTNTCTSYGPPAWMPPVAGIFGLVLLVLPLLTAAYLTVRMRKGRSLNPAVAS